MSGPFGRSGLGMNKLLLTRLACSCWVGSALGTSVHKVPDEGDLASSESYLGKDVAASPSPAIVQRRGRVTSPNDGVSRAAWEFSCPDR
jgi:hypothetical protein